MIYHLGTQPGARVNPIDKHFYPSLMRFRKLILNDKNMDRKLAAGSNSYQSSGQGRRFFSESVIGSVGIGFFDEAQAKFQIVVYF